jgi:hypothetical protein
MEQQLSAAIDRSLWSNNIISNDNNNINNNNKIKQ